MTGRMPERENFFTISPLFTDLYEISMAGIYFQDFPETIATFELWIRDYNPQFGYYIFSGLEFVIDYLLNLHFSEEEIQFLKEHPMLKYLPEQFFNYLSIIKFTGDLWAVEEGKVVFPGEPLLRIKAPLIEAQLVETALLNFITYSTLVSTKAKRVCYSARLDGKERVVIEFGARRSHGPSASLIGARAAYIGGCNGTSNLLASKLFGIPCMGTMAHSYVMSYPTEEEAFQRYQEQYPTFSILLVDTYNTMEAVKKLPKLKSKDIKAIRIDSGDLFREPFEIRSCLDSQGFKNTGIFLSGDLDEYIIYDLILNKVPADGFGVGTKLVTGGDEPYLSTIYKLVALEENGKVKYVAKLSSSKETYPGEKEIIRIEEDGRYVEDIVVSSDEVGAGEGLLKKYIDRGRLIKKSPALDTIRSGAEEEFKKLPDGVKSIRNPSRYPIRYSDTLKLRLKEIERERGEK